MAEEETGDLDFILSDTEAAIRALLKRATKSSLCPRLVFKHQLYEIVYNKTEIESDLEVLRSQNRIRLFEQIPAPNSSTMLVGVMLNEDYIEDVSKMAAQQDIASQSSSETVGSGSDATISVVDHRDDLNSLLTSPPSPPHSRKRSRPPVNEENSSSLFPSKSKSVTSSALQKFALWLASHTNISVLEHDLLLPFTKSEEGDQERPRQTSICRNTVAEENKEEEEEKEIGGGRERRKQQEQVRLSVLEVQALNRCGFLQQRVGSLAPGSSAGSGSALYALTHPRAGMLSVALASAQKYLLQRLRMTKYKELAEKKLITEIRAEAEQRIKTQDPNNRGKGKGRELLSVAPKRIECSSKFPLGLRFHLSDLLGRRVLTRVTAPSLSRSRAEEGLGGFTGILRLGPAAAGRR